MRVVAGTARGVRLIAPPGRATRPTSDRVKEAVLNSLQSHMDLVGVSVADLYCGSGALGIEALSRGAGSCVFVDSDQAAVAATNDNVTRAGVADRSTVVRSDVLRWIEGAPSVDVVLMDPPYEFDAWETLLGCVRSTWAVTESDRELAVASGWELLRSRRYGTTWVQLLHLCS